MDPMPCGCEYEDCAECAENLRRVEIETEEFIAQRAARESN